MAELNDALVLKQILECIVVILLNRIICDYEVVVLSSGHLQNRIFVVYQRSALAGCC